VAAAALALGGALRLLGGRVSRTPERSGPASWLIVTRPEG
jgi:hypothetical protein